MRPYIQVAAIATAVFLFPGAIAHGDYGVYLHIDGVEGGSQAQDRNGWIDISSISHEIQRAGDGRRTDVDFSGITALKTIDKSTPVLMAACASGEIFPEATIDFVRLDGDAVRFYRVRLIEVTIHKGKVSIESASQIPLETIGLEYRFIEWDYTEFAATGTPITEHRAWWDRATDTGGSETNPIDDAPPPTDPETFRRSVRFTRLDGDDSAALLSWDSREGKSYAIYYSPDLLEPFDTLVEIVPSDGDGITSTVIDIGETGDRAFFIVRELD